MTPLTKEAPAHHAHNDLAQRMTRNDHTRYAHLNLGGSKLEGIPPSVWCPHACTYVDPWLMHLLHLRPMHLELGAPCHQGAWHTFDLAVFDGHTPPRPCGKGVKWVTLDDTPLWPALTLGGLVRVWMLETLLAGLAMQEPPGGTDFSRALRGVHDEALLWHMGHLT